MTGVEVRSRKLGDDAGFTLIEILVALGILATVLPALLVTFSNSSRTRSAAESRTTAAYLVRDTLAELQSAGTPTPGDEEGIYQEGVRFQWRTSVAPTDTEGLFDVVATVVWLERGQERELGVRTYIADTAVVNAQSSQGQSGPQGP